MLIEVAAATDDNPALDLAGDAGAVGRVILLGGGKTGESTSSEARENGSRVQRIVVNQGME